VDSLEREFPTVYPSETVLLSSLISLIELLLFMYHAKGLRCLNKLCSTDTLDRRHVWCGYIQLFHFLKLLQLLTCQCSISVCVCQCFIANKLFVHVYHDCYSLYFYIFIPRQD
jgi:hypothetical protein